MRRQREEGGEHGDREGGRWIGGAEGEGTGRWRGAGHGDRGGGKEGRGREVEGADG